MEEKIKLDDSEVGVPIPLLTPQSNDPKQQAEDDVDALLFYHTHSVELFKQRGFPSAPQVLIVKNTATSCKMWDCWIPPESPQAYQLYWEYIEEYNPTHIFIRSSAVGNPDDKGNFLLCATTSGIVALHSPHLNWSILGTLFIKELGDSPWVVGDVQVVSDLDNPLCNQTRDLIKIIRSLASNPISV